MRPIKASEIAAHLGRELVGNDITVKYVSSLQNIKNDTLVFAISCSEENLTKLNRNQSILALVSPEFSGLLSCSHILTPAPRLDFGRSVEQFFMKRPEPSIAGTTRLGKDGNIETGVSIGEYCVIGDNVSIGAGTEIRHHVVIADTTRIGCDCIIRSHTVIGEEGYGVAGDNMNGPVKLIPQLGGVQLGDNVELGTFCTVNRGAIDDTIIGDRTKIGHHVNIGHNVTVGQDTFISSCVEVSGSTRIGKNVWIGPCVSIREWLVIGDRSLVGIGSNVTKSVDSQKVVFGHPAQVVRDRV